MVRSKTWKKKRKIFSTKIGHTAALQSAFINVYKNYVTKASPNYYFFTEDKTTVFCPRMWFYTTFSDNEHEDCHSETGY